MAAGLTDRRDISVYGVHRMEHFMTSNGTSPAGGTVKLGDRTISRIGYGAMQLERLRDDRAAAIALLRRARELGVDHVDTA